MRWTRLPYNANEFITRERAILVAVIVFGARIDLAPKLLARDDVVDIAVEIQPVRTHLSTAEYGIRPILKLDRLQLPIAVAVGAGGK